MKYLFYVAKQYSLPIVRPLIEYLISQGQADFGLYVSDTVARSLPAEWKNIPVLSDIASARRFAPEAVLAPGNFVDFRIPGIKVQLFHGLALEKPAHFKIRHFFDVYCTSGPAVTGPFMAMQKKYGYFRVLETGWPKIDHIVTYPSRDLRQAHGISPECRVVLYAPTFSSGMQSAADLLPCIPSVITDNQVWLIKFHELMDREMKQRLHALDGGRVRVIDEYDITPYLHMADVLVSDTSSVVYEFLVLNKPVITYRTLARKDKGLDIQTPGELSSAIETCLAHPEIALKHRNRHIAEVNPRIDGTVSKTVFTALENLVRNGLGVTRRKPLNLFRKLQVVGHGVFRKGYLR